jgi:hypothetical protein
LFNTVTVTVVVLELEMVCPRFALPWTTGTRLASKAATNGGLGRTPALLKPRLVGVAVTVFTGWKVVVRTVVLVNLADARFR